MAVTAGGRLYTWGAGGSGALGTGQERDMYTPTRVKARGFGGAAVVFATTCFAHSLVVTRDGALWACGTNYFGALGLPDNRDRLSFLRVGAGVFGGKRIVGAAAGFGHSVAVTEDGGLWTWGGYGESGQLGHNDDYGRRLPTLVAGAALGGERVGRCRALPAEHALAFAMGTHQRLGAASPVKCLAGEVGLLRMIAGWCRRWRWVSGAAGKEEGVVRLLGGW